MAQGDAVGAAGKQAAPAGKRFNPAASGGNGRQGCTSAPGGLCSPSGSGGGGGEGYGPRGTDRGAAGGEIAPWSG